MLYPVGRLDWESEGLVLLTNDGELTNKLLHPSSEVPRTYQVKLKYPLDDKALRRLRRGIRLDDGPSKGVAVEPGPQRGKHPWYAVTLREGRTRQVRRMMEAVGNDVLRLRRVRFGSLELTGLRKGAWRELGEREVIELYRCAGLTHPAARRRAEQGLIGTLRYAPPEQAGGGEGVVDGRLDLYALGRGDPTLPGEGSRGSFCLVPRDRGAAHRPPGCAARGVTTRPRGVQ